MTKAVDVRAKKSLARLVSEAEQTGEIVITRAGKPVAKLIAVKVETKPPKKIDRTAGFMKGQIKILKGFYDPLPDDFLKAFRGEDD